MKKLLRLKKYASFPLKFDLKMKVTVLLLIVSLFQLQANESYAQKTKISLDLKNVSLEKALDKIESLTEFKFIYVDKQVDYERIVSIKARNENISIILNRLFEGSKIGFNIMGKQIIVKPIEISEDTTNKVNNAQNFVVTGVVEDEGGQPLPGANILEKGTINGVVSDFDGKFTIKLSDENATLVVSYIGFISKEIPVNGVKTLNIVLSSDASQLGEIVITALGIKKEKKALTYSVQKVSSEGIVDVGQGNFITSLAGKVTGVNIKPSSSGIGGDARVIMRGTTSINSNNNALYVLDGVPMPKLSSSGQSDGVFGGAANALGGISMINQDDIESISVLSGASAAALYGTQAANGVILVNTKKGKKGKPRISLSNRISLMNPFVMPRFQNTYGSNPGSFYSWGDKLKIPSTYNPVDFFQTGINQTTSLSLSTGSENNQTFFSTARQSAEGIIPNNTLKRYNFSIRNTTSLFDNKVNLNLTADYTQQKDQNMITQGQYFNPLIPVYLFPRGDDFEKYKLYERYNATRNLNTQFWPYGDLGLSVQNPYWIVNRNLSTNSIDRYKLGISLKYNVNDWININGRIRSDNSKIVTEGKRYASTYKLFASDAGHYSSSSSSLDQIYSDIIVNINKRIDNFGLTGNIGAVIMDTKNNALSFGGNLLQVPNLFSYNAVDPTVSTASQGGHHDQTQSVFASTVIDYQSKIFLELTARNDWPSALANTTTDSFLYPSVGISAVVSDLLNLKSSTIPFIKVRGSYSEVGNAPSRFISTRTYKTTKGTFSNTTYRPVENLEPELTKSYEAGINLRFFDNMINVDVTAYTTSTYNQIFNPKLSTSSGYSSLYINAGRIDNKGIEAALKFKKDFTKNLRLESVATFTLNRNEVVELLTNYKDKESGLTISSDSLVVASTSNYAMVLTKGGTMGDIYVNTLKKDENGYVFVNPNTNVISPDPNNFIKAGTTIPKYILGFRNAMSYRNLNFSFLVNASVGGIGVSSTQALMDAYGVSQASADARDRGGATVNSSKIGANAYYSVAAGVGSRYVYSATNVRLAEASLSYTLEIPWIDMLQRATISISGRNLFMFYNKAPFDPDSTSSTGTYFQGIDYFRQPSLRSFSMGVNLQF